MSLTYSSLNSLSIFSYASVSFVIIFRSFHLLSFYIILRKKATKNALRTTVSNTQSVNRPNLNYCLNNYLIPYIDPLHSCLLIFVKAKAQQITNLSMISIQISS